jgi:hypothetical protein
VFWGWVELLLKIERRATVFQCKKQKYSEPAVSATDQQKNQIENLLEITPIRYLQQNELSTAIP